jgi:hypothetical protein
MKEALSQNIVDEKDFLKKSMNEDELRKLFSFNEKK